MLFVRPGEMEKMLKEMWDTNKDYLRRLLIGFTRDIDVADDLLQETYLRARTGITGYRGGDARAWLATIAKNTFYAHLRQRSRRGEVPIDDYVDEIECNIENPADHLNALEVRKAISDLVPSFRTALIMKHFGGFTYSEIAERLGCPVGTAKWRVSMAMKALRGSLGEELARMECKDFTGTVLVDYIYGVLPAEKSERVNAHLRSCAGCSREVDEIRMVATALDRCESDYKLTSILELDEEGQISFYYSQKAPIADDHRIGVPYQVAFPKHHEVSFISVDGEELQFKALPIDPNSAISRYDVTLPRSFGLGDRPDMLVVGHQRDIERNPEQLGDGRWRLIERYPVKVGDNEWVLVYAIRLPVGARLAKAVPEPSETRINSSITLVWRRVLLGSELMEYQVEYQL